ncbi:MAG TPA: hypothetical protein VLQ48_06105, partial [Chloroflexia bacterium]|nr:hypothetical protein [Chloroflexia bacterium]
MTSPITKPDRNATDQRLQRLHRLLSALERRFRLQEAALLLPWALGLDLALVVLLGLSMRLAGWPDLVGLGIAGVAILLASCACVLLIALVRPRAPLATALQADIALGLDERLSTALEDASSPPTNPTPSLVALRDAQLDDALHSLEAIAPAHDLPITLNKRLFAPSGALVLLLLAVMFFPAFTSQAPPVTTSPQVAAEQQNIEILKQEIEKSPSADD